jgi:AcrR family transcriptional regulator
MPRVVKEEDYAARRNEILDVARRLIYTKGYEQMSIQDILDALKISKGAFYHYFDSKQALLDGLVDLMLLEADVVARPILEAQNLSALEKLQRYLDTTARWKVSQKSFMLNLMRAWRMDSNALMRQKQENAAIKHIAPMLATIVRQGVEEGAFSTKYPDQFASMLLGLSRGFEETIAELLLTEKPPPDALERLKCALDAYSDSLERVLGAPAGSLPLGNMDLIAEWLAEPLNEPAP